MKTTKTYNMIFAPKFRKDKFAKPVEFIEVSKYQSKSFKAVSFYKPISKIFIIDEK